MGLFDNSYMQIGAQANAVKAYLELYDGVDQSWDCERKSYAPVDIAGWYNGRERGYVIMFKNNDREQLNIAFFEHRNSDDICALKWIQSTLNPPTIESAKFGEDLYKDKCDVSKSVGFGGAAEMADWIMEQLSSHWVEA